MQPVRDETGRRYLLLKESDGSSLVRDPETGDERYMPADTLEPAPGTDPLEAAAGGVPASVRRVVRGVHDEQTLGLLVELTDRGPIAVRELLDETTYCESDLHGRLAELVAVGLINETTVVGERGYEATTTTTEAVKHLRTDETC